MQIANGAGLKEVQIAFRVQFSRSGESCFINSSTRLLNMKEAKQTGSCANTDLPVGITCLDAHSHAPQYPRGQKSYFDLTFLPNRMHGRGGGDSALDNFFLAVR